MKLNARVLRSEKGFSLIELMIVVAIIGILATVAVPNFTRFQNKAKQSEAKGNLGSLYTAMHAFKAEWNGFYGDFKDIGFQPNGKLLYNTGFTAVGTAPAGYTVLTGTACPNTNSCDATFIKWTQFAAAAPTVQATSTCTGGSAAVGTPTATAFTAGASGTINGTAADVWAVDQNRVVCNTTPNL